MRAEGFAVEVAHDGPDGVALCDRVRPDLVVLDLMLPGLDGLEVCRRVQRDRPVPVLMLTARGEESDLLVGLAVGADDYMTKPFSPRELVARVRALLRRVERRPGAARRRARGSASWRSTRRARLVRLAGEVVHLTPTEFDLLALLAARPGAVFSREQLLADVWGWRDGSRPAHGRLARARAAAQAGLRPRAHRARRRLRAGGARVRPLDRLRSIKVKLGVVIVATVAGTVVVLRDRLPARAGRSSVRTFVAAVIALAIVQFLARGMTSPLREMAAAATAMARGDYGRRVRATSHDEVGELARAFNAMAAELADVDRMRRDLVANVSHELRTPIGALQALLENLVDGVEPVDPAALRTALVQTERLGRLVEQLLDLSRLESGALALRPAPFPVRPLLEQATRECELGEAFIARPVWLRVDVQPGDLRAIGDSERLHQVISNLLENAVRHSPARRARVAQRPRRDRRRDDDRGRRRGPGHPAEEAERVFERFHRVDAARAARDGGTGLGLAIARWIVDAHGGTIARPRRASRSGCRVVVELPR